MSFKVSLSVWKSAIQLNCMMIIRTILQNGPSASWTELLWFDLTFIAGLCGESWISQILKSVNPQLKPQLYTSAACCTSSRCTDSCLVNWQIWMSWRRAEFTSVVKTRELVARCVAAPINRDLGVAVVLQLHTLLICAAKLSPRAPPGWQLTTFLHVTPNVTHNPDRSSSKEGYQDSFSKY